MWWKLKCHAEVPSVIGRTPRCDSGGQQQDEIDEDAKVEYVQM